MEFDISKFILRFVWVKSFFEKFDLSVGFFFRMCMCFCRKRIDIGFRREYVERGRRIKVSI